MKKFFTLALLAATLLLAAPAQAQIAFGVKAGMNMTKFEMDGNMPDTKTRNGFFVGPTVKFTLPIVGLGVDASALYNQVEAKYDEGGSIKQQSLQIPVNVRYGIGLGDLVNVFAFAGPQFGFNIGDKSKDYGVSEWKWNTSNLSANIGVGATLFSHLQATVNYNFALGKTGEFKNADRLDQYGQVISGAKGKGNSWQIGVAYFF
jgi:hypothetical protein